MSEYKPLAALIIEGLEEGTVLECNSGGQAVWGGNLYWKNDTAEVKTPFSLKWRVISTPPKKIEFVCKVFYDADVWVIGLPKDHPFEDGAHLRVTVEEKR